MQKIEEGMAEFLRKFADSPYVLPGPDYQRVDGISTLTGSWKASPK